MITYEAKYDSNRDVESLTVETDGRVSGKIVKAEGGWRYIPKSSSGKAPAGEIMPRISQVMRSLEGE